MDLQAVIFDLDGTLIDSMQVWISVDKEYLGKRGITVPDDLFQDIEEGDSFVEVAKYFKKKFNLSDSTDEIMQEWTNMVAWHYENNISLKPGAKELLYILKEHNIKVAVGTSNSLNLAQKVLKANDVLHLFDCIVAGCKKIRGKPFPDIFLQAASELNVPPEHTLVIEDVLVGVIAAKKAGMKVFAIGDEHSKYDQEKITKIADFYAKDFWEIKKKIDFKINKRSKDKFYVF